MLNKSNGLISSSHQSHSSSLSNPIKHLSESLTNLHLNQKNNNLNLNSYASRNLLNNNHLSSEATCNLLNNNNSHNLSHATSLSALNHLKTDYTTPTLPSLNFKSQYQPYNSSNSISGLSPNSTAGINSAKIVNMPTTKITSVVRPVMNDSGRPITQTVHPSKLSSIRGSVTNLDNLIKTVPPNERSISVNNETTFIIPETRDHSADLDFNDFLPKHIQQFGYDHQPLSEMDVISSVIKGHKAAKAGLDYRRKQVQIVLAMWATKDSRTALEYAVNLDEKAIIIDILNVMILKP